MRRLIASVPLFCLSVLVALPLSAQDISGTIEGTVLDPSGSAVANAKVTVTNQLRNQVVRTITTGDSGAYAAPFSPVGTYSVKVEAPGFKTATISDIALNVNDDLKINVNLQLGAVAESVDVKEQTDTVDLATAANSSTIEGTQVRELMLSTRNYEQLVSLAPGVTANSTDELYIGTSAPAGTAATIPYSVNGNRNSANNWTVDGADNVDRGSNLTLMVFPSVDSIDEFKVERSLYTADTGRAGGAQVSVVTRSGASQFHGSLYEFIRNNDFNANNFINNANSVNVINGRAQVPPLRWNDFGGTIGGPVYVPGHYNKDRNKTFFFFSEEARRIITYTTFQPIIPTSGMVSGAFATPVCISYTTSCQATATQIPTSQINPIALQYIKDIYSKLTLNPTSTTAGFFPQRNLYDSRQEIVRLDHRISERFSLWGKFENDSIPTTEPGGLFTGSTIPNGAITNTNSPGRQYVIHGLDTLRANILNEVGFSYSHSAINSTPVGMGGDPARASNDRVTGLSGHQKWGNRQDAKTPRIFGMRKEPDDEVDRLAHGVIGAAIEVHRVLGPGYLESVYQEAMEVELGLRGIAFERQVVFAVDYKGTRVGEGRIDLLVEKRLVVELKTADALLSVHKAQALSYLRALDLSLALLINFKVAVLRDGIKRVVRSS